MVTARRATPARGGAMSSTGVAGSPDFAGDKGGAVMNLLRVRRLFAGERVARFGIAGPGGQPHLAPAPFAVIDDGDEGVVVCTLDVEPRSLIAAAELRRIAVSPRVSILVDGGVLDAPRWWVRADAVAEVLRAGDDPRFDLAAGALRDKYAHVEAARLTAIVWATVVTWTGWTGGATRAATAA